jgi:hypothetical protein
MKNTSKSEKKSTNDVLLDALRDDNSESAGASVVRAALYELSAFRNAVTTETPDDVISRSAVALTLDGLIRRFDAGLTLLHGNEEAATNGAQNPADSEDATLDNVAPSPEERAIGFRFKPRCSPLEELDAAELFYLAVSDEDGDPAGEVLAFAARWGLVLQVASSHEGEIVHESCAYDLQRLGEVAGELHRRQREALLAVNGDVCTPNE